MRFSTDAMLSPQARLISSSRSMTSSPASPDATTESLPAADACTSPWTATAQTGAWFSADGTRMFLAKADSSLHQKTQSRHTAKKTADCSIRICTSLLLQKTASRSAQSKTATALYSSTSAATARSKLQARSKLLTDSSTNLTAS